MKWKILQDKKGNAEDQMRKDSELLTQLEGQNEGIIRFYEWALPSVTYGYFLDPNLFLDRTGMEKFHLSMARRPTGGGIVFHLNDFAYSILVPACFEAYSENTLENYAFVNQIVSNAITTILGRQTSLQADNVKQTNKRCVHYCMANPVKFDVMLNGKKVGGGAQRRTKDGFLHQGTIQISAHSAFILKHVVSEDILEAILTHSGGLLDEPIQENQLEDLRKNLCIEIEREAKKS